MTNEKWIFIFTNSCLFNSEKNCSRSRRSASRVKENCVRGQIFDLQPKSVSYGRKAAKLDHTILTITTSMLQTSRQTGTIWLSWWELVGFVLWWDKSGRTIWLIFYMAHAIVHLLIQSTSFSLSTLPLSQESLIT